MSDAYADAGHAGDFTTFKNRTGDYKAGEVKHAIDHLLHSAGAVPLAVLSLPQEEEIGKDGLPCVSWPSDHLSICVEFAISEQPARSADPLSPDWAAKQGAVCPPAAAPAPAPAPAESPGKGAALQPTKARAVMYALTSGVTCFNFLLRNGIPHPGLDGRAPRGGETPTRLQRSRRPGIRRGTNRRPWQPHRRPAKGLNRCPTAPEKLAAALARRPADGDPEADPAAT